MLSLCARHRASLAVLILGLVASGVTAFPLLLELRWFCSAFGIGGGWFATVRDGLEATYAAHPWMGYGTDWLAFAHLVIALFFIGPWRDPVRNNWVVGVGMVACAGVPVLAFVAGGVRGIPVVWRLVDCSFGVVGILPLAYCWRLAKRIEAQERAPGP